MKFNVKKPKENIRNLGRKLGYIPRSATGSELSFVRPLLGKEYPRFHLYIKEEKDGLSLSLHLDQKKPSYKGTSAHSGEYEGGVVEEEAKRIKKIIEEQRI